ncbi:class I SAM-dependent methyltransferase [Dactylosporangium roseum]|uniref:Class I SAM-dependent methyltransferase n=1 Tax=Dactylosporangium roseum TaxID=47989 RepID=A0ABY5YYE7_9ACTN|nr:class I SAM-dependent methyltransferase [Dactylosporangium roseum]UWZ34776.1 class I SAM-dependent methyltransferase [Dactylosporangium roseum]
MPASEQLVADRSAGLVQRLLSIVDAPDAAARLAAEDPEAVVAATVAEVAGRTVLYPGPGSPVTVQFDVAAPDGGRIGHLLTVGGDGHHARPGRIDEPWVWIKDDLASLVREVFGPPDPRAGASREVVMRDEPGPVEYRPDDPWLVQREEAVRAAYQVVQACGPYRGDLSSLAVRFGSDKWGGHWYTPHYERHLGKYRDQRVTVLEIGIGGYHEPHAGGASLRMWKHYFHRGTVYGLDVYDKSPLDEPRLVTVQGDQSDPAFLADLAARYGPFDVMVDDGSHVSSHVITSFNALFPHVRPGGMYVVEDLHTSYWPEWGGNGTDLADPATSVGFLKTLVDGLHHRDRMHDGPYEPSYTDQNVAGIFLHHNLAFVEKGRNTEQANAAWRPRYDPMRDLPAPQIPGKARG